jgi:SAM-dependent methyltransferase
VSGTPERDPVAAVADLLGGFFGTWVMNAGYRSGLLARLRDDGPLGEDDLAERAGLEARYVRTWCRAAFAAGVLELADGVYELPADIAAVLLDPATPAFMGGRALFFPELTPDLEMLPDRMADGGSYPLAERSAAFRSGLAEAVKADAPNIVTNVLPAVPGLNGRLHAGGAILDAGCIDPLALGAYGAAYPEAKLHGTAEDQEALDAAAAQGNGAELQVGGLLEGAYDSQFDLIVADVSLSHTWGMGAPALSALRDALRPGGWLLVSDIPYPDDVESLRSMSGRLFVGVTIYVSLLGFELYTEAQLRAGLEAADFDEIYLADQPAPTRMMVLARRPD